MRKIFCLLLYSISLNAQAEMEMRILNPPPTGAFAPGDSVEVEVLNVDGEKIWLLSTAGSVTPAHIVAHAPYRFSIQIGEKMASGIYSAKATDISTRKYRRLDIIIEPKKPEAGGTLELSPSSEFFFAGGQTSTGVVAFLNSSGTRIPIDESPGLKLESDDTNIVSVDVDGRTLIAEKPGSTFITYSWRGLTGKLPVTNRASSARGDINNDGYIDMSDVDILRAKLNQKAKGSNDISDLNRDGVIDALDLRVLTTICTRPRCAAQ